METDSASDSTHAVLNVSLTLGRQVVSKNYFIINLTFE